IRYAALDKKLTLFADDFFTHSVVFTPTERPFFCIENQSCSTDAHNLYAQGLQEAAHLTILEPGESLSASITFQVSDL
ncbi:MAG: aldose 1-epimerase, partial [Anaerolineae bacterium]